MEIDLQAALANVYDLIGYDLAIDYTHSPEVPLEREEDDAWVTEWLRSASHRSPSHEA